METRKKFGLSLLAVNLTGILLGLGFWLIKGVFAGLIGFMIGLIGSTTLIFQKQKS